MRNGGTVVADNKRRVWRRDATSSTSDVRSTAVGVRALLVGTRDSRSAFRSGGPEYEHEGFQSRAFDSVRRGAGVTVG